MREAVVRGCLLFLCCASLLTAAEPAIPANPSREQIKAWRKEGPGAVDRLMREREKLIEAAKSLQPDESNFEFGAREKQTPAQRAAWEHVVAFGETIDAVAGARYSHESGLYWYTDEEEAKRVAETAGKPLLALRLLGNLDEELSCANSRYFRILLYPDDNVRRLLHDKFILTWKSVRAVPKITIDLGDGRKVERSITGNSVHYVVLPDGKIVDVFPGLYGPRPFHERLATAHSAALRAIDSENATAVIADYRARQIADLQKSWKADLANYEEWKQRPQKQQSLADSVGQAPWPQPGFWEVIATFHPEFAELSQASKGLLKHEAVMAHWERLTPDGPRISTQYGERVASIPTFMKGGDEAVLGWLLNCVEPALQADTLHNEYNGRHFALRHYLGESPEIKLDELNTLVYQHIFAYDPHDPWIGLANLRSLTALPKDRGLKRAVERKE